MDLFVIVITFVLSFLLVVIGACLVKMLTENIAVPEHYAVLCAGISTWLPAAAICVVIYQPTYQYFYDRPEAYETPQYAGSFGTALVFGFIILVAFLAFLHHTDFIRQYRRSHLRRARINRRSVMR